MANKIITPEEFWKDVKKTVKRVAKKHNLGKENEKTLWVAISLWLGRVRER